MLNYRGQRRLLVVQMESVMDSFLFLYIGKGLNSRTFRNIQYISTILVVYKDTKDLCYSTECSKEGGRNDSPSFLR